MRQHTYHLGYIRCSILHLAPFKFLVVHIHGSNNVVADCLARMFEDNSQKPPTPARQDELDDSTKFVTLVQEVPASSESLFQHQKRH